jgi:alkyl hydroperoxide reductase subunit F
MLDAKIKAQLTEYLGKIDHPFVIHYSVDESDKGKEMLDLLTEIHTIEPRITLIKNKLDRTPSFTISNTGITFACIPLGHEFTNFVIALLWAGGYPMKVEDDVKEQIKQLPVEGNFETYVSLSCHNCPDVVQAFNTIAFLNHNISHTVIDGALFPKLVEEKNVLSVPMMFKDDELWDQGRMELDEILRKLDANAESREAEKLNDKTEFDVLVVGGGPAGASSAIYTIRKGLKTGIVADRFGGQVVDTLGIENFISVQATEGPKLVKQLEEHVKSYPVDVMHHQRAKKIKREGEDKHITVTLENGAELHSKTVILSTGARWRQLGVPGEQEYNGKGVAYCPHCDGPLFIGKPVAVVGGGNSGVEAAIDLANIVDHVTVIEYGEELKADAVLVNRLISLDNVTVITNAETKEIKGKEKVTGLTYVDRNTEERHTIDVDGVFVQIGLVPNTDWLEGSVALTKWGEIEIDKHNATSMPGVFAAGDCTDIPYKQIIIAMGEGANAGLGAFDYLIRH